MEGEWSRKAGLKGSGRPGLRETSFRRFWEGGWRGTSGSENLIWKVLGDYPAKKLRKVVIEKVLVNALALKASF